MIVLGEDEETEVVSISMGLGERSRYGSEFKAAMVSEGVIGVVTR